MAWFPVEETSASTGIWCKETGAEYPAEVSSHPVQVYRRFGAPRLVSATSHVRFLRITSKAGAKSGPATRLSPAPYLAGRCTIGPRLNKPRSHLIDGRFDRQFALSRARLRVRSRSRGPRRRSLARHSPCLRISTGREACAATKARQSPKCEMSDAPATAAGSTKKPLT
jgi:hypothetical protein